MLQKICMLALIILIINNNCISQHIEEQDSIKNKTIIKVQGWNIDKDNKELIQQWSYNDKGLLVQQIFYKNNQVNSTKQIYYNSQNKKEKEVYSPGSNSHVPYLFMTQLQVLLP